jgi:hypothetical protein
MKRRKQQTVESDDAPGWLDLHWKDKPDAPQSGGIEERAVELIKLAPFFGSKPKLFKALALDLMTAALEEARGVDTWTWPRESPESALEQLMKLVLGLPAQHTAGNWQPPSRSGKKQDIYDGRGSANEQAITAAALIEISHHDEHGGKQRISLHELEREMKQWGFNTNRASLREWRKHSYYIDKGHAWYLPPL